MKIKYNTGQRLVKKMTKTDIMLGILLFMQLVDIILLLTRR